jgi:hypothetical protein
MIVGDDESNRHGGILAERGAVPAACKPVQYNAYAINSLATHPQLSWRSAVFAICLLSLPSTAAPQSAGDQPPDQAAQTLKRLSLEELTER